MKSPMPSIHEIAAQTRAVMFQPQQAPKLLCSYGCGQPATCGPYCVTCDELHDPDDRK